MTKIEIEKIEKIEEDDLIQVFFKVAKIQVEVNKNLLQVIKMVDFTLLLLVASLILDIIKWFL